MPPIELNWLSRRLIYGVSGATAWRNAYTCVVL